MKKNLLFILLASMLLFSGFAKAQTTGGPDAYGYIWRNNLDTAGPVYNWVDISTRPGVVTVSGLADDNIVGPFSVTIPFHYYWYDPSSFFIGSNGYIGFTNHTAAVPFPFIPATANPNDWLAVFAADFTFTDMSGNPIPTASCMYWQGNDSLIVTWQDVPFWDSATVNNHYEGDNTFQVIISAVDSSITYQYLNQQGDISIIETSDWDEIGIENVSGAIGLEVQHALYPTAGEAIKFYYPDTVSLAVTDAASEWTGDPGSKGIILATGGLTPYTSTAEVKNAGNQTISSFKSASRVINAGNIIQVRDTVIVTNLAPSATQMISYANVFNPTVAGKYRQLNTIILTGDANAANNVDTLELWVVNPTLASVSLQWDNGTNSGVGVSWTGGGGGIGMHFTPPYYPAVITAVGTWVISDTNHVGYHMLVYADDGPGGAPGTKLDSFYVAYGSYTVNAYYQINTTAPISINSGGFYVAWVMGGDQITLGQDPTTPHSHQSWEILGAPGNPAAWAEYRDGALQDPIIHAIIQGTTGTNDISVHANKLDIYPNPARFKTTLKYNLNQADEMHLALYTIEGALVSEKSMGEVKAGEGAVELNLLGLNAGVYMCKITVGTQVYNKRINVVK